MTTATTTEPRTVTETEIKAAALSGYRVGPHMVRVVQYIAQHPGCSILNCTAVAYVRGGHKWTYAAVHRAEKAGLLNLDRAEGRSGYACTIAF